MNTVIYKYKDITFQFAMQCFSSSKYIFETNLGTDYSLIYGSHIAQFSL